MFYDARDSGLSELFRGPADVEDCTIHQGVSHLGVRPGIASREGFHAHEDRFLRADDFDNVVWWQGEERRLADEGVGGGGSLRMPEWKTRWNGPATDVRF